MARRSGWDAAAGMLGWGARKGFGLGVGVVKSPFRLAKAGGRDVLLGGGNMLQQFVAMFMWGFYGILAFYLAALLRKTGWVPFAPITWLLIMVGIVFLTTLILFVKLAGVRSQARLRRALITIEKNTTATRDKVEQLEADKGKGDGGGWDISDAFKGFRKPKTAEDQMKAEQAQYVADNVTEEIPDWMRRMAGEKVRRWPWKRGPK